MFDGGLSILDWLGVIVFTITGALVASRKQMDVIGFVLLGTITGIGGGTIRDVLLGVPIIWFEKPAYLIVCLIVSVVVFFAAHLVHSRLRLILWMDAAGLALFATVGAEKALLTGTAPIVAVVLGVITACFGGIIRDTISQEQSIIFSYEIYVTAALASAVTFVVLHSNELQREMNVTLAVVLGFSLRAGALRYGWSLPRYRPRPPRQE